MSWMFFNKPVDPPKTKWERRFDALSTFVLGTIFLLLTLVFSVVIVVGMYICIKVAFGG